MAFLDNSGDIILDAVLTDAGRQRMARGEFKIVKFALSDEEVDYELFNGNHPNGSAFADLSIMQTPILEAFTNNTSLMKTKLISINRNNILFLPIFKLNNNRGQNTELFDPSKFEGFYISADETTDTAVNFTNTPGFIPYDIPGLGGSALTRKIRVDQGLDTGGTPSLLESMPDDLKETAYLVRIDHRLLRLHAGVETGDNAYRELNSSFVDDDAIASYYIPFSDEAVDNPGQVTAQNLSSRSAEEMFDGPLGPQLSLTVRATLGVQSSEALFEELGSDGSGTLHWTSPLAGQTGANYMFIDTIMNVVGVTTGYSIDIPLRIWKKVS